MDPLFWEATADPLVIIAQSYLLSEGTAGSIFGAQYMVH